MGFFGKSEELFPFFAAFREIREDKILCFCYTEKKKRFMRMIPSRKLDIGRKG